jgi:hypothetical protein
MGYTVEELIREQLKAPPYSLSDAAQDARLVMGQKMGFLSGSALKADSGVGTKDFMLDRGGSTQKAQAFVAKTAPDFSGFLKKMDAVGGLQGSATGRFLNEFCDGGQVNNPACNTALREFGDKVKTDPNFIKNFDDALRKDPSLAQKMKNNPSEMSGVLRTIGAAPAVGAPAPALDKKAPAADAPRPARPSPAKPEIAAQVAAVASGGISENTPKASETAPKPSPDRRLEGLKITAGMNDAEIRTMINNDPNFVKDLAGGIREYADKNFPELDKYNYSDAFHARIAGDPKLQGAIAENLKAHPDFVRKLAKMSSDDGSQGLPEQARSMVKGEMKRLFENPQMLADPKYVEDMSKNLDRMSAMKSGGNALGGMGDWFKNNLGIDMGGMMGGIGAFFQQVMGFVSNFMSQITGGNFISMRNSGMDLFGAFKESMNQAALNMERSSLEKGYLQVVGPTTRADGFMKDADGKVLVDPKTQKPIENVVQNTIDVTSINGTKHAVYASTGLNSVQRPGKDGKMNYEVRVATGVDENGRVTKYEPLVLSKEEFQKYIKEVEGRKNGSMQYDQNYADVMGVARPAANGVALKAATSLGEAGVKQPTTKVDVAPGDGKVGEPVVLKMDDGKARWGAADQPTPAVQTFPLPNAPKIEEKSLMPSGLAGA